MSETISSDVRSLTIVTHDASAGRHVDRMTLHAHEIDYVFGFAGGLTYVIDGEGHHGEMSILAALQRVAGMVAATPASLGDLVRASEQIALVAKFTQLALTLSTLGEYTIRVDRGDGREGVMDHCGELTSAAASRPVPVRSRRMTVRDWGEIKRAIARAQKA